MSRVIGVSLAFDISTTNIGVFAIIKKEVGFETYQKLIIMPQYEKKMEAILLLKKEIFNTIGNIDAIINAIQSKEEKIENVIVSFELANFGNAKLTQRFSRYVGIFEGILFTYWSGLKFLDKVEKLEIKHFNANEWFKKLANLDRDVLRQIKWNFAYSSSHMERVDRKQIAKNFYELILKKTTDSEDIADAFCVAFFAKSCRNVEVIEREVSEREIIEKKIKGLKKKAKKLKVEEKATGKNCFKKIKGVQEKILLWEKELKKYE